MASALLSCIRGMLLLLLVGSVAAGEGLLVGPVEGERPSAFGRKGFYVGPEVGVAYNAGANDWQGHGFTATTDTAQPLGRNPPASTFAGGVIIGYQIPLQTLMPDWTAPIVFGPEIDFNYLGQLRRHEAITYNYPGGGSAPPGIYTLTPGRDSNYFGTVRSRIGYVWADSKAQMYFSAGLVYAGSSGGGSGTVTYTAPTGASTTLVRSGPNTHTGSVFALGWGYSFHPAMAVRLEMLYVDLKTNSQTFSAPGAGSSYYITSQAKGHFTVLRIACTYHF